MDNYYFETGEGVDAVLADPELKAKMSKWFKPMHARGVFKPRVYEAAQYTTMSTGGLVAALDCISTMHKRHGLMKRLVDEAEKIGKPVFKWNLWDVIEPCRGRSCSRCPLNDVCEGKARKGGGYFKIDDAITQLERTKAASFNLEMLCGEGGKKKGGGWTFGWRKY